MARSPSDATRFTSTVPYAASTFTSNGPLGSRIDFGSAPAGETPQQKIARLRAAAALAKQGKETTFDKTVRVGRTFADRAHRVTALGLIGFTVVATAVAVAGITDMMLHNRRRRREWLAEKQAEAARNLMTAKEAERAGRATEDQLLLINRERVAREAEESKKSRPGVLKRLFSGTSTEDKGVRANAAVAAAETTTGSVAQEGRNLMEAVKESAQANRRQGEKMEEVLRPNGGPLDREAQSAANAASQATKSWTSWLTGR